MSPAKLVAILLVGAFPSAARAQLPMQAPPVGTKAAVTYSGPADVIASPQGCWSLRACAKSVVVAGSALTNIIRASDSHTCDVTVSATGGLGVTSSCSTGGDNGTAVATWCNATTCSVTKLYDQSGNAHDASFNTTRPTLNLSGCSSAGLPCMSFTNNGGSSGTCLISASGVGTGNQPYIFSAVYTNTFAGTVDAIISNFNGSSGSELLAYPSAGNTQSYAGSFSASVSASDGAWHVIAAVFNSSSSVIKVDATSTTVNPSTGAALSQYGLGCYPTNVNQLNGKAAEFIVWNGSGITGLCANQQGYWGTPVSC